MSTTDTSVLREKEIAKTLDSTNGRMFVNYCLEMLSKGYKVQEVWKHWLHLTGQS